MKNRTLCLLLALLTVSGTMLSCGEAASGDKPSGDTQKTNPTTTEPAETEPAIKDNLPDLNFGDKTVSILHFGFSGCAENDTPDWDMQGDIVHDAVYQRDMATEERLGVKLAYTAGSDSWETYPNEVQKMIKASDCPYDIIFLESSQCFRLCLDGYFMEVSELPYVDLNQPWWYKNFMDGGSISVDKRYFLTGAFSVSTLRGASCTVFNKKLFNNYFETYTELYDLVDAHKWTYDKLMEYCVGAYTDVNGDSKADADDIYGLFNRGQQTVNYVSMSIGLPFLKRDSNNLPVLDIYNDDSARWIDKLYRILYEDNISYTDSNIKGEEHFADGKSLFYLGQLGEYTGNEIRSMNDPYGVLPMPVLDEGMNYMSAAGTVNGQSAVIPVTAPLDNLEMYGAVLESLSIEAYRTVIPAWYEVALKSKYADTARDSDMIDVIYNSIDTSFIMIADKLLGTGSFFWNMVGAGKKNSGEFASFYEKQAKTLDKKWAKMIDAFDALD